MTRLPGAPKILRLDLPYSIVCERLMAAVEDTSPEPWGRQGNWGMLSGRDGAWAYHGSLLGPKGTSRTWGMSLTPHGSEEHAAMSFEEACAQVEYRTPETALTVKVEERADETLVLIYLHAPGYGHVVDMLHSSLTLATLEAPAESTQVDTNSDVQNEPPRVEREPSPQVAPTPQPVALIRDVGRMREHYPDYAENTGIAIYASIPEAWRNYCSTGQEGRWGPARLVAPVGKRLGKSLSPATVSRYLKAFHAVGIRAVKFQGEEIEIPYRPRGGCA